MSEHTSTTTPGQGPVIPLRPDVSALKRPTRAQRLAAAQTARAARQGLGGAPTATDLAPTEAPEPPDVLAPLEQPLPPPQASPDEPAVHNPATPPGDIDGDSRTNRLDNRDEAVNEGSADTDTDEYAGQGTIDVDDDEDYAVGKTTRQAYVPDAVATKFKALQMTGRTAEAIVLTAVNDCAARLPELIRAARGPVQESGLFPGIPIIDRGPGRRPADRPNNARIQYQVAPQHSPALIRVAKQHRLKLSVLIRLALGDYFGIPVRLDRIR